jgi:phosphoribosylformylglycinamidine synthase subunit PurL
VQGNTALAMPDDAGVVRVDETTGLGVALSTDCNARFAALDPYAGAQLALAEAYRNVATVGAKPLAVTDCLNFGSPEDPEVMWQFAQAVTGLADGCQALGVPVTGGNVSLYNSTGDVAIHPTPVVGVLGVLDDVSRRTPSGWRTAGQAIFLIGTTRDELGGSSWTDVEHGHLGGLPPAVDLEAERVLGEILVACSRDGLVDAAHDLSDGGLALALVESCLRYGVGARIWLDELCERDGIDPFVALFSESTARALVAVPRSEEVRFTDMCTARRVAHKRIGVVDDGAGSSRPRGAAVDAGQALDVQDLFVLPLAELRAAHEATLPAAFDN